MVVPYYPFPYIEAVNLIQLIGETKMLPLAFYECCQDPLQALKGVARADGTVETLDLPTLGLCISAPTNLIQRQALLNADVFCSGPAQGCPQAGVCRAALEAAYREVCECPAVYLSGRILHSSVLHSWRVGRGERGTMRFVRDVFAPARMERGESGLEGPSEALGSGGG